MCGRTMVRSLSLWRSLDGIETLIIPPIVFAAFERDDG
jgi:hypothetical protein